MSDDLIPTRSRRSLGTAKRARSGRDRRLRAVLVAGIGLAMVATLVLFALLRDDDGSDDPGALSTTESVATTTSGRATSSSTAVAGSTSSLGNVPTAPGSTTSGDGVDPGTTVPATALPADREAAVAALVEQGLTGSEATCIVNRATEEFGDPGVLTDPNTAPEVSERLVQITQDCLFG